MGNLEALKKLYVAMGGAEEDVENLTINAEVIAALSDLAEAIVASILPEVTDADDGKVLTVVDGKWTAQ